MKTNEDRIRDLINGSRGEDKIYFRKLLWFYSRDPESDSAVKLLGYPTEDEINSVLSEINDNE